MMKWLAATCLTISAFAATAGARTPDVTPTNDAEIGGCRYLCSTTNVFHKTPAACNAACPGGGDCEPIC